MGKIYYIDLRNIDISKLLMKLHNIGYVEQYMNDISFCPYLIVHKNFEKNKSDYVYRNINLGFLNTLKNSYNVIEDDNIDDFITHVISIQSIKENALF